MKRHNSRNAVYIVLIVVAVGFSLYLLGKSLIKNPLERISTQESKSTEKPLPTIPSYANPIFQQVKEFIDDKTQPDSVLISEKSYVWWVSDDGYNIINYNAFGVKYQFNCKDYAASIFDSSLKRLAPLFPTFIQQLGFVKNNRNSSTSLADDNFYDYVQAYEKGELKCTLTANSECSGIGDGNVWQAISFSCTSDFDKNYRTQKPFLSDLQIKNAVINVSKQVGDFVYLDAHARRTGWYIIAMKQLDNRWKELHSGQDIPSCLVMNQYNVPKEIYRNCF